MQRQIVAMLTRNGVTCTETALAAGEDTPQRRAQLEDEHCNGAPNSPLRGSWVDCSQNEYLQALFDQDEKEKEHMAKAKTREVPALKGSKIKAVRLLTAKECGKAGVEHEHAFGVELDSGVLLIALRDPEGNGLGHMIASYKDITFDVTNTAE